MENSYEGMQGQDRGHREFGFFLPLIVVPLTIGLMVKFARHKYAHMAAYRRENWKNGVPPMFAELHRRAHAAEAQSQSEAEKTQ